MRQMNKENRNRPARAKWARCGAMSGVLFLILGALGAGPAGAQSLRDAVELALSSHESVPTKAKLLDLSPQVDQVLREIAEDPSPRRPLAQMRALSALQLFPSKRNAAAVQGVIKASAKAKTGLPFLRLKTALLSLAVMQGPAAVPSLAPFLRHHNVDVRAATVRAVAASKSPRARQLLKQQQQRDASPIVRAELKKRLARLKAAQQPSH